MTAGNFTFFDVIRKHVGNRIQLGVTEDPPRPPTFIVGRLVFFDAALAAEGVDIIMRIREGRWKDGMVNAITNKRWHVDWEEGADVTQYDFKGILEIGTLAAVGTLPSAPDVGAILPCRHAYTLAGATVALSVHLLL